MAVRVLSSSAGGAAEPCPASGITPGLVGRMGNWVTGVQILHAGGVAYDSPMPLEVWCGRDRGDPQSRVASLRTSPRWTVGPPKRSLRQYSDRVNGVGRSRGRRCV